MRKENQAIKAENKDIQKNITESWKIMEDRWINRKTIKIMQKMYSNNTKAVLYKGMQFDRFVTEERIRQGGELNPSHRS